MTSRPAPLSAPAGLSPSSALTRWWTGASARAPVPRTIPPVWWTSQVLTKWPLATSTRCSTLLGTTKDSCWWPTERRCWKKGLRWDKLKLPLLPKVVFIIVFLSLIFLLLLFSHVSIVAASRQVKAISANHRRKNLANQKSLQLNQHQSFITGLQVR